VSKAFLALVLLADLGVTGRPSGEPPDVTADVEVMTQGACAPFKPSHLVASTLNGRVVRRTPSGDLIPVANVTFSYIANDGSATPVPLAVDPAGRFETWVVAMGPRYTLGSSCISLDANARGKRLKLVVNAPGCQAGQLKFGPDGATRDVVMRCAEVS